MATNRGKNRPAETFDEMVSEGIEKRTNSKLYKAQSAAFVDGELSDLIRKTSEELAAIATSEPVTLSDAKAVKQRTLLYLRACEESACFPSVAGLARSMGLTRHALYDVIEHKRPAATAEWLEVFRDACSDILSEASLRNNANSIISIFLQKSLYGLIEKNELTVRAEAESPLGGEIDQRALEEKIADIVVEDTED